MQEYKCHDCDRIASSPKELQPPVTCKKCGSEMELVSNDESEETDEEEDDDGEVYTCDVCDESFGENDDDLIAFDNDYNICKECIDAEYPRQKEVVYKDRVVEKIVEKLVTKPVIESVSKTESKVNVDFMQKSRFD